MVVTSFHLIVLRNQLLQQCHDYAGHVGRTKTLELLRRIATWPHIFNDVKKYVQQCSSCQRNKPSHQLPHGLLQPLEIPDNRWQSIAIDFITGLPKSNGIDAIMTVTDRLTKMVHLLPTQSSATASDIASLFFRQIVRFHGIPKDIVSDRDSNLYHISGKHCQNYLTLN